MWSYNLRLDWQVVSVTGGGNSVRNVVALRKIQTPLWAPVVQHTHAQYVIKTRMFLARFSRVVTGSSYIFHPLCVLYNTQYGQDRRKNCVTLQ